MEACNLIEDLKLTICTPILISSKKLNYNSNTSIIHSTDDIDLNTINVLWPMFLYLWMIKIIMKKKNLQSYCVDIDLMKNTAKNNFLHCLPAKVG